MLKKFFKSSLILTLAALGLTACNNTDKCCGNSCKDKMDEDQLFTGVLPAADSEGIRYQLKLDYDHNFSKGDYDLVETYLVADSTAVTGVADKVSYKSEGDFTVVEQNGKKYLKLLKDIKDSHANAASNLYFEVSSDSTLTMVNADLQPAADKNLNYTLKLVK